MLSRPWRQIGITATERTGVNMPGQADVDAEKLGKDGAAAVARAVQHLSNEGDVATLEGYMRQVDA